MRVERMNKDPAAAVPSMTPEQLEAFYTVEYPKLVKILAICGATIAEAEDAAQKTFADFVRRSKTANLPEHPAAYVRCAARRFFIKERERDRERLLRELRGGYLVTGAHIDDQLACREDEQYIEHILQCLTPTQQQVIKLVMEGLTTREIAAKLGKNDATIRQQASSSPGSGPRRRNCGRRSIFASARARWPPRGGRWPVIISAPPGAWPGPGRRRACAPHGRPGCRGCLRRR